MPAPLPTADEILEFINEQPGRTGKREIARAFGIKGAQRIELKRLLRQMTDDGLLNKEARRFSRPGELPPVGLLDVVSIDDQGEPVGQPPNWDTELNGPVPNIVILPDRKPGSKTPGIGARVLARFSKTDPSTDSPYPFEARIIRHLASTKQIVIGVYRKDSRTKPRLIPVDKKSRNELEIIDGDDAGAKSGELVAAELVKDRGRGLPRARIRERLGNVDDQRSVSLIAIYTHGIPNAFSEETLSETKQLKPVTLGPRQDIRDIPLITIDPADARDHDDAVWAEPDTDPKNAGGCRVIVAIADVSHYVQPGTSIDREGYQRGNSVYFPDRVVPMLPERISTDLCSLRPLVDRPALAVTMVFDSKGQKRDHAFSRVLMRSAAKLSYTQAQAAIDGNPDETTGPLVDTVLKPLWAAYDLVRQARSKRQPLDLDLPERKIILDDNGYVSRIITPERLDAHKLIEEFMIMANVCAAETLEKHKSPLLYRVHDSPSQDKLLALSEFLATIDMKVSRTQGITPKDFNAILKRVKGTEFEELVNSVVLRSQSQAEYGPENYGHFGLNLRRYAHFTSPIRRYADLIVHRSLIRALGLGKDGLDDETVARLGAIGEHVSDTERRAMAAERETVDRLMASHLSESIGASFEARISGLARAGLFVRLQDSGADGFVPAASLTQDYFVHDERRHAFIGEHTGETFRLGDQVTVRLLEVTPLSGGLRFELMSDGTAGKPAKNRKTGRDRPRPSRRPAGRRRR